MTVSGTAALGHSLVFEHHAPLSAAGGIAVHSLTPHFAGVFPLQIPGIAMVGDARIDVAQVWLQSSSLLSASGTSAWGVSIPSNPVFVGVAFDVQSLDLDLVLSTIYWSQSDAELTIGSFAPPTTPIMVAIQAGTFQMGSFQGDPNEQPVHAVTITRPFWVGKYEVTQAQYLAVMGSNPSFWQAPQRPVEQVTWYQATAYCVTLTASEAAAGRIPAGYQYRLPTEAEWEYVCRAGTTTEWNTGASLSSAQANFSNPLGPTTSVGSYAANPWGLFDTHGNVAEWCLDSWDGLMNYPSSAVADPYGNSGPYRVFRGASYGDGDYYSRSAGRQPGGAFATSAGLGFRVVLAPVLVPNSLLNMLLIQAGTFQMGSVSVAGTAAPAHTVTITRPFWVGKYEVTQAEYQMVMGSNPSFRQGAQRPVEQVSWHNAMAYCSALTATEAAAGRVPEGYQYRLPTEAEWEYVCRAGTTTEWNTGSILTVAQANCDFNRGQTTVVGSYPANPWGLFDTHGNVWEWCLDSHNFSAANYPSSAVTDPYVTSGLYRVLRGGSYFNIVFDCRSALRNDTLPSSTFDDLGFRVVLAPVLVP